MIDREEIKKHKSTAFYGFGESKQLLDDCNVKY